MYKLLGETFSCQNFRLMADELPADNINPAMALAGWLVHNQMIADGQATTTRYAKMKASLQAWDKLNEMTAAEFKKEYGCQCKAAGEKKGIEEVAGMGI
jgi:endoribonuclease Dicer